MASSLPREMGVGKLDASCAMLTRSMRVALTDFKLDELRLVHPGEKRYALAKKVEIVPLAQLVNAE